MTDYTQNFSFTLIDYNTKPWDQQEHNNWRILDAALAAITAIPNHRGEWKNGTVYGVGQTVVDTVSLLFYKVATAHTSAAVGTFAADRAANPTYWALYDQSAISNNYFNKTEITTNYFNKTDSDARFAPIGSGTPNNRLIDGRFDYWQTNGLIVVAGYGGSYAWRFLLGTGATGSVGRIAFVLGQTAVPGEPKFFASVSRSVAGSAGLTGMGQRIRDVRTLAGKSCRYRFWARSSSAAVITVGVDQSFGTGGAPSATVTTLVTNSLITDNAWRLITGAFAVPSVSGKVLGSNGDDYFALSIGIAAANSGIGVDISSVQFWEGSADAEFNYLGEVLEFEKLCAVYQSTYSRDVNPGANGAVGVLPAVVFSTTVGIGQVAWQFPVQMLAVPTITVYSPVTGATGNCRNTTLNADIAAGAQSISTKSATLFHSAASTAGHLLNYHAAADCRL